MSMSSARSFMMSALRTRSVLVQSKIFLRTDISNTRRTHYKMGLRWRLRLFFSISQSFPSHVKNGPKIRFFDKMREMKKWGSKYENIRLHLSHGVCWRWLLKIKWYDSLVHVQNENTSNEVEVATLVFPVASTVSCSALVVCCAFFCFIFIRLHCALSLAAQCIVIGPLCLFVFVCGSVTTITRNCLHRSSPNWVCRWSSDHLRLTKFLAVLRTCEGGLRRGENFLAPPYRNKRDVCVSMSIFSFDVLSTFKRLLLIPYKTQGLVRNICSSTNHFTARRYA